MATIPVYSPVNPFLGLIPGGLRHGVMLRFKGVLGLSGNRFTINLQTGCVTNPRDDVALQLSLRPSGERCIVRNHMTNQIWGAEERFGGMPLHPGQVFDILILTEASAFKIAVNNIHFCMFQFRIPIHRVQFISLEGDAAIQSITMEGDNYQAPPPPPPQPIYPPFPHAQPHVRPPQWSVGAVPVLPPIPPPSYSPYPPGGPVPPPMAYGPTMAIAAPMQQKKKSKNKALKAAAIVGGVGLGAFAVSRALNSNYDSGEGGDDDGGDDCGGDE